MGLCDFFGHLFVSAAPGVVKDLLAAIVALWAGFMQVITGVRDDEGG